MNLPRTITSPDAFMRSEPAGYDGVFDWSWTAGCFGETAIKPMDIDAVVERRGRFLVFETKEKGKFVPEGQKYTLRALERTGVFTILMVYGKLTPEECKYKDASGNWLTLHGHDMARAFCREWYLWANSQASPKFVENGSFSFCPIGAA